MKFNELNVTPNRRKNRVGRGISGGQGKTAGRGTKGQGSRTGSSRKPGFEGGQNPLMQRLPKLRGFRSLTPKAITITTDQLNTLSGTVDNFTLFEAGLVLSPYDSVKVVLGSDVTAKLTVHLQGMSKNAEASLQKAGGSFKATPRVARAAKQTEA